MKLSLPTSGHAPLPAIHAAVALKLTAYQALPAPDVVDAVTQRAPSAAASLAYAGPSRAAEQKLLDCGGKRTLHATVPVSRRRARYIHDDADTVLLRARALLNAPPLPMTMPTRTHAAVAQQRRRDNKTRGCDEHIVCQCARVDGNRAVP